MKKADGKTIQTKLAGVAFEVFEDIQGGKSPNESAIKRARNNSLSEEWTRRVCELTNRMVAMNHFENAESTKRAGEYPTIDADAVIGTLFPVDIASTTKAAHVAEPVPGERFMGPVGQMAKAASTERKPCVHARRMSTEGIFHKAAMLAQRLKRDVDSNYSQSRYAINRDISEAFKKAANALVGADWQSIEERMLHRYGEESRVVMDLISQYMPKHANVKRFDGKPRVFTTNPWETSPFKECQHAIGVWKQAAIRLENAQCVHRFAGAVRDKLHVLFKEASANKDASAISAMMMARIMGLKDMGDDKVDKPDRDDILLAGIKPQDIQNMRAMAAREALAAAVTDPVISSYPLSKITQSFNRISHSTPRIALDPEALVSLMRRDLEEPDRSMFDIEQQQKVEKQLSEKSDPMISTKSRQP